MLSGLDLDIPAGQRVLLAGPSGSGKSTLLRAIGGLLLTASHGDLTGEALVGGAPVAGAASRPALLLQDPLAGVVAETVGRDVAFGLENLRTPPDEIWPRVRGALEATRFPYPERHPTTALSGGETQRLTLAGSLVLDGGVLLLDEPTSMLDPASAASVHSAVRRYLAERGPTLVVVEHHLEPWLDIADRLVVLGPRGDVVADGDPREVLERERDALIAQGIWVPGSPSPIPVDVPAELVTPWTDGPPELLRANAVGLVLSQRLTGRTAPPTRALGAVDAAVRSGRTLAVTGASGAGKSSLVSVLAGLRAPTSGVVESAPELGTRRGRSPYRWRSRDLAARLAWVPQSPEHGIVARSVGDEMLVAARECGRDEARARRRSDGLLEIFGLAGLAAASPYHLSGGEQRRLMVAAALASGPYAILLDEPTIGQDRATWAAVVGAVAAARSGGSGVVLASHDALAVDALADDRLELVNGERVS